MTQPPNTPWTPPIDLEAVERLHRYGRLAAERMARSSDPHLAEIGEQIARGHVRPRDLLLSPEYRETLDGLLRQAVQQRQQQTAEEQEADDIQAKVTMESRLQDEA